MGRTVVAAAGGRVLAIRATTVARGKPSPASNVTSPGEAGGRRRWGRASAVPVPTATYGPSGAIDWMHSGETTDGAVSGISIESKA